MTLAAQSDKVIYTPKAHTTGGRDGGVSHSSDDRLDISPPGLERDVAQALADAAHQTCRKATRGNIPLEINLV
jgi:organic hydroperoxide reductase OsmC/OhrA